MAAREPQSIAVVVPDRHEGDVHAVAPVSDGTDVVWNQFNMLTHACQPRLLTRRDRRIMRALSGAE